MAPVSHALLFAAALLVVDGLRNDLESSSENEHEETDLEQAGPTTMMVVIPQGVYAGQMVQVQAPSGQMFQIEVPPGVQPGQQVQVVVPDVQPGYNGANAAHGTYAQPGYNGLHAHHGHHGNPRFTHLMSLSTSPQVLVPALVPGPGEVFEFKNKEKARIVETNEYKWMLDEVEQPSTGMKQEVDMRIATLKGKWQSNSFGHQSVHAYDESGTEIFKIRRSTNVWNPAQRRWSFRILPPGSKDNAEALFTINKDQFGKGLFWMKEEWKVYRGRERDGNMVMYCVGSYLGWDFKMYRNKADYDQDRHPIAKIEQKRNLGAIVEHNWLPDKFKIKVYEGGDAALALALSSIIDMVHDSKGGSEGYVRGGD